MKLTDPSFLESLPDDSVVVINENFEVKEITTFDEYAARGRVEGCNCGLIQCACLEKGKHKKRCGYRFALTCAIPISCVPHGLEVCPVCDPCTCEGPDLQGEEDGE